MLLMAGFVASFTSVLLGQRTALNFFVCPPGRQDSYYLARASDKAWVGALFDLDKGTSDGYGFVEGDVAMRDQIPKCLRTSNHCLLVRIALPIGDICNGFFYPKGIRMHITRLSTQIFDDFRGAKKVELVPVNMELYFVKRRSSGVVSDNDVLKKRLTKFVGCLRFDFSSAQQSADGNSEYLGTFSFNDSREAGDRKIVGESRLDILNPFRKIVVTPSAPEANAGDSDMILDYGNLSHWPFASIDKGSVRGLTVGPDDCTVRSEEDDKRGAPQWKREN